MSRLTSPRPHITRKDVRNKVTQLVASLFGDQKLIETTNGKKTQTGVADMILRLVDDVATSAVAQAAPALTEEEIGHVAFLEETLVPDLIEMGRECTAEDFEKAIKTIRRLAETPLVPECLYN